MDGPGVSRSCIAEKSLGHYVEHGSQTLCYPEVPRNMGLQARNVEAATVLPEMTRSKDTVIWHSLGTPAIILHDHEENKIHGTLWQVHAGGMHETSGLAAAFVSKAAGPCKNQFYGPQVISHRHHNKTTCEVALYTAHACIISNRE